MISLTVVLIIFSALFSGVFAQGNAHVNGGGTGRNKDRISDVVFGARCIDDLDTYIPIQGNISIKE